MLGHELVHADRYRRGVRFPTGEMSYITYRRTSWFIRFLFGQLSSLQRTVSQPMEELAAIGLAYNDDYDITENDLREEHGLDPRGRH